MKSCEARLARGINICFFGEDSSSNVDSPDLPVRFIPGNAETGQPARWSDPKYYNKEGFRDRMKREAEETAFKLWSILDFSHYPKYLKPGVLLSSPDAEGGWWIGIS